MSATEHEAAAHGSHAALHCLAHHTARNRAYAQKPVVPARRAAVGIGEHQHVPSRVLDRPRRDVGLEVATQMDIRFGHLLWSFFLHVGRFRYRDQINTACLQS